MNHVIKYLKAHKSYARMKEMKASGFHTREIQKVVDNGNIVKVKPGLYRLAGLQPSESYGHVEVCLAMPKAVICLSSALAIYELTTVVPPAISYAIPRSYKLNILFHSPTESFYFSIEQYKAGIENHEKRTGQLLYPTLLQKVLAEVLAVRRGKC